MAAVRSIFKKASERLRRAYRSAGPRNTAHALGPCIVCCTDVFEGGGEESRLGSEVAHSSCLLRKTESAVWRAACAVEANALRPAVVRAFGPSTDLHTHLLKLERRKTPPQECFEVIVMLRCALNAQFNGKNVHHRQLRGALDSAMQNLRQAVSADVP